MGIVVTFRKAGLAERVARQYGWQIRRLSAADGGEARQACRYLDRSFVFQCFDPSGKREDTDLCCDTRNAWELACNEVWYERLLARRGEAGVDRYEQNNGGLSTWAERAA